MLWRAVSAAPSPLRSVIQLPMEISLSFKPHFPIFLYCIVLLITSFCVPKPTRSFCITIIIRKPCRVNKRGKISARSGAFNVFLPFSSDCAIIKRNRGAMCRRGEVHGRKFYRPHGRPDIQRTVGAPCPHYGQNAARRIYQGDVRQGQGTLPRRTEAPKNSSSCARCGAVRRDRQLSVLLSSFPYVAPPRGDRCPAGTGYALSRQVGAGGGGVYRHQRASERGKALQYIRVFT